MTTAHRPTFVSAKGTSMYGNYSSGSTLTHAVHAKDVASHTTLKLRFVLFPSFPFSFSRCPYLHLSCSITMVLRQDGQSTEKDLKGRNLREELEERERQERKEELVVRSEVAKVDVDAILARRPKLSDLKKEGDGEEEEEKEGGGREADDSDANESEDSSDSSSDDDDSDDSDDDDSDDDDEEELQRELQRIRAEREVEKRRREEEDIRLAEEEAKQAASLGNPLMPLGGVSSKSALLKRRWNDDVVFRNQGTGEPDKKKRFVNDTVRNDFHRQFISRYMK